MIVDLIKAPGDNELWDIYVDGRWVGSRRTPRQCWVGWRENAQMAEGMSHVRYFGGEIQHRSRLLG